MTFKNVHAVGGNARLTEKRDGDKKKERKCERLGEAKRTRGDTANYSVATVLCSYCTVLRRSTVSFRQRDESRCFASLASIATSQQQWPPSATE